jgi:hypothetical protein
MIADNVPIVVFFFSLLIGRGLEGLGSAQFTFISLLVNVPLLGVNLPVTTRRSGPLVGLRDFGDNPPADEPVWSRKRTGSDTYEQKLVKRWAEYLGEGACRPSTAVHLDNGKKPTSLSEASSTL